MSWKYVITTLNLQRTETIQVQAQIPMQFLAVALATPLAHQHKHLLRILSRVAPKRFRAFTGLVLRPKLPSLGSRTSLPEDRPASVRTPASSRSEPLEELLFKHKMKVV